PAHQRPALGLLLPDQRLHHQLRLLLRRRPEREDHLGQARRRHAVARDRVRRLDRGASRVRLCLRMVTVRTVAGLLSCWVAVSFAAQPRDRVTAQPIEKHIRTLSADAMEGRGLGTQGLKKAADYIEAQLKAANLKPAFGKSYRQKFPVKMGVELGEKNAIAGLANDDWTPLGFSSSGAFSGPIAFVGYGIDAPPLNYREYEGIDLKGKVALMLRYEPQERDDKSPFDGRKPSRWSAMRYKAMKARDLGAVAVIFVTGPMQDEEKDKLPALTNDGPESPAGLPIIQVKTSTAKKWIDLDQFQKDVDADLKPRSRVLDAKLTGTVDVKAEYAQGENVAGPHYDHRGYGGHGSMRPNDHAIHNGADDNASGTAAVMVAAGRLKELLKDSKNHRTVLIALFSAEEVGLG